MKVYEIREDALEVFIYSLRLNIKQTKEKIEEMRKNGEDERLINYDMEAVKMMEDLKHELLAMKWRGGKEVPKNEIK